MLLQFSIGIANCLKKSCFLHGLTCLSFMNCCIPLILFFEGRDVGSESEKELFNHFTMYMYVFPELMLVFAYTSFPFGFDARLWGLIVTSVSDEFLQKIHA